MSKETPAQNVVKGSFKGNNRPQAYFSDKNTPPYNDVVRYDAKTKESYIAVGLTEEEKIAEGSRPPLQFQNEQIKVVTTNSEGIKETRIIRTKGRFEKDKFERSEYKEVHSCKKMERNGSVTKSNYSQKIGTLIVHLSNFRRKADYKDHTGLKNPAGFKTTYAFQNVKENEIFQVLSTIVKLDRNNKDDKVLNYVKKYYFAGKEYSGKGH